MTEKLPRNIYRKSGKRKDTYWTIKRRQYHYLGDTLEGAIKALAYVESGGLDVEGWAAELAMRCRRRAKQLKLDCVLTKESIMQMIFNQRLRCAVTGRRFSDESIPGQRIRMYAPSVDRLDNSLGYTHENVRIVCAFANIAMNKFGEDALRSLARDLRKSKISDPSETQAVA